jgi:hypothetical protein
MRTRLGAIAVVTGVLVAVLGGARPAGAQLTSTVTVSRPDGQVLVDHVGFDSAGRLLMRLVDTRSDDPGWAVNVSVAGGSLAPEVVGRTEPFTDGSGATYAQQVEVGTQGIIAKAPRGHGLGIAQLRAAVSPSDATDGPLTITITVV